MGFFSAVKKFFSGGSQSGEESAVKKEAGTREAPQESAADSG